MSKKKSHNGLGCKCPKCMSKRAKSTKKNPVNDHWQRFRGDARAWHEQNRRDEKRYNDLCGEVTVTKIKDKDERE